MRKKLLLLGFIFLTACTPQAAGPSVEEVQAQIDKAVELTVSAHYTEVAERASPTSAPTFTPSPTLTPLPTLTPFPTQTATSAPVQAQYACAVTAKVPYDNTEMRPNTDFDVKFWLKNVGSKAWGGGADLLYAGGTNMLTTNTRYELPQVDPGKQVGPFIFDARSPSKAGTFVMTFKVQGGFCYPYVRIVVKR